MPRKPTGRDERLDVRASRSEIELWHSAAKQRGTTVSEVVRRLLDQYADETFAAVPVVTDGQMTVDEMLGEGEERSTVGAAAPTGTGVPAPSPNIFDQSVRPTARIEAQRFSPSCRNGTYHWKHGPGNPCRSCEGEI